MNDPIRIPVISSIDRPEAIVTPDIARQIVALAAPPTTATPPAGGIIEQLAALEDLIGPTAAETLLAAIKAGRVPGIYHISQIPTVREYAKRYDEMKADLAACRGDLSAVDHDHKCVVAERDKALTDLAACRAELEATKGYQGRDYSEGKRLESQARCHEVRANAAEATLAAVTAERDRLAGLLREYRGTRGLVPAGGGTGEEQMKSYPDIDELEDALRHLLHRMGEERRQRANWSEADKDEMQRRRISAVRRVLCAIGEFL